MNKITLNTNERRLAEYLANRRNKMNKDSGTENQRMSDESDIKINLEGVGAEIAFCKMMNVYPDMETDERGYADAATVVLGMVDVKATKYRNGHLLAMKGKDGKPQPDNYVLMIGEFPTYMYAGHATTEELIKPQNIKDLGRGEGYMLPQSALHV